jgi:uncharacterized protein
LFSITNLKQRAFSRRRHLLAFVIVSAFVVGLTPWLRYLHAPSWVNVPSVHAAAFTPGNLVIYRVGDGSGVLGTAATAVFLDEYTTSGSFVQTIALPTAVSGANKRLTAVGNATSEGLLTRSVDNQYLLLTGYDAAVGTASLAGTTSAAVNRVIGRVSTAGTVDTTTALSDASTGSNPRSAISTDGTNMWFTGGAGGPRFTTFGSTTSTQISTTTTNLRQVNIFNGQLYVTSMSGATRMATIGAGTPTTSGQTITNLTGLDSTNVNGPYGFFFADLDAGVAGSDTLYIVDDSSNIIRKFSLVAGTWTAKGSIALAAGRGITGVVSGANVTLYVTNSGTTLATLTDTSGYNATMNGTVTSLATAAANTAFRGVAFAPAPAGDSAPSVSSTTPTNGASAVALSSDISITFSEPVDALVGAFSISCATSGAHTFFLSGGATTFTLNPDSDFVNDEQCTVTVDDAQVTDQDLNDPPDNMAADYVFSFNTVAAQPTLNIGNVTQAEGNAGTTNFNFTVSLTAPAGAGGVSFTVNTADGSTNPANAGSDYVAIVNGAGNITSGNTSTTVTVTVNGDGTPELNETFFVNISNVTGATGGDLQGLGTITNDDIAATPIHTIQGSGNSSPLVGQSVTTTGIVTGRKTNGYFIQDPSPDADPNTSEGMFVFTSSTPSGVAVGDSVSVTATVAEFISPSSDEPVSPSDPKTATELTSPTTNVLSSGNSLPAALPDSIFTSVAASRGAELEKYEYMRVAVTSLTVSEPTNNNFGEFWGVTTGTLRPYREPGIEAGDPIPAADQGPFVGTQPPNIPIFDGNFERIMVDSDESLNSGGTRRSALLVTTGAVITGLVGPLDYAFDNYRIVLDATATTNVTPGITAFVPVPTRTADEFTVGHANLENFGVSNAGFAGRLNKASLAIRNVMRTPDVLGMIEIFDLTTLQQLATKVNTDAGNPAAVNYVAYLDEGVEGGGDDQDIGFLVNTARVSVVGSPTQYHKGNTFTYCGVTSVLHDRPSYLLNVTVPRTGGPAVPVTVIINHTKSLIASDSQLPFGSCGTGTEGARNREKRRLQAEDIADLIETHSSENLVVLGDLNAFDFNDGLGDIVGTLKGSPVPADQVVEPSTDRWTYTLTNLGNGLPANERYSFAFEGNAQALDHVLVSPTMLGYNTRFAYGRYNGDFSIDYAADTNRPERLADHDPAVAYFSFPPAGPDVAISMTASRNPAPVEFNIDYNITVTTTGLPASDVEVTDTLPTPVTLTGMTTSQGTCSFDPGLRQVTCELGTVNIGSPVNIVLTFKPRTEGTLNNTADVTTSDVDTNPSNNSASVNGIPAVKMVDLAVSMFESADPIFAGQNETYTITVKNFNTYVSATGVALTDTLPASMTFVSATTSQGSLVTPPVGSTGTVTANLGTLAVNATATVTITAQATAGGTITNSASASSNEADFNAADNTASSSTTVKTAALQKVLLAKQVLTGGCENTTGNVYLTGPAGPGGMTVPLSSNISGASVPASVFIPAGQMVSPAFNVTTSPVAAKQVGLITAGSGPGSVSRGITINKGSGVCPP